MCTTLVTLIHFIYSFTFPLIHCHTCFSTLNTPSPSPAKCFALLCFAVHSIDWSAVKYIKLNFFTFYEVSLSLYLKLCTSCVILSFKMSASVCNKLLCIKKRWCVRGKCVHGNRKKGKYKKNQRFIGSQNLETSNYLKSNYHWIGQCSSVVAAAAAAPAGSVPPSSSCPSADDGEGDEGDEGDYHQGWSSKRSLAGADEGDEAGDGGDNLDRAPPFAPYCSTFGRRRSWEMIVKSRSSADHLLLLHFYLLCFELPKAETSPTGTWSSRCCSAHFSRPVVPRFN